MVAFRETAEEQLLRMIEGPSGPPPRRPRRDVFYQRLLERLREGVRLVRRWLLPGEQRGEPSDVLLARLRLAERVAWMVLIGLGCYLVADLLFLPLRPPPAAEHSAAAAGSQGPRLDATAETGRLKSVAEYRQTLLARNPFALFSSAGSGDGDKETRSRLVELTSTLAVVGINRGRTPEALVEDTAAKRTYIVQVGGEINGLRVKRIDQRGVVVTDGREETLIE